MAETSESRNIALVRWGGLVLGPVAAVLVYAMLPGSLTSIGGEPVLLSPAARALAAVGVLMALWWISEALPLEATALVPLALFPLLGIAPIRAAAAPYADPIIFLFMGGLILGLAMERWGLHKRIALYTIRLVGTRPMMLIGGVMLATAVMSMWVSNTATVVMMLPIGMSISALVAEASGEQGAASRRFGTCIMLAIAYAASIGGVGTIVGTPPNAVLAGIAKRSGIVPELSFARWMLLGVPIVAIFLPLAWVVLTRVLYRISTAPLARLRESIAGMIRGLGPMSRGEWSTFIVFMCTALLWISRGWLVELGKSRPGLAWLQGLEDAGIAIIAALALFIVPVNFRKRVFVMDWHHAVRLPWGVLILFGGGLSLASGMTATGLDQYLAAAINVQGLPPLLVVLILTTAMVFLTEVASNTAVATTFLPLAMVIAGQIGVHPYVLMAPLAIAASYAFMMPMGTPPNALVFASRQVTIRQMAGAGVVLNLAAIVTITLVCYFLGPLLLGYSK
jgi:solute carrier family 13 (sodium-dependent dicarboxylate transporter), member 2/3/5